MPRAGGLARPWLVALLLSAVYAVLAGLWIWVHQAAADLLPAAPTDPQRFHLIKDIIFLLLTAAMLYLSVRWGLDRVGRQEQGLRERNEALHTLVQASPLAIYTLDVAGNVGAWNPAAERLFGWTAAEVLGGPLPYLDADTAAQHRTLRQQARLLGGFTCRRVQRRRRDGALIDVEISVSPVYDARGEYQGDVITAVDVTEQRRAQDEAQLLQSLALAVNEAPDPPSALAIALQRVAAVTGWAIGMVWMPEPDGQALRQILGLAAPPGNLAEFIPQSAAYAFAPGEGLPGRVWATGQAVWLSDVTEDDNFPRAPLARRFGIKAGLGVPVLAGDAVVAVMEFFLIERREQDERLVGLIAAVAAQLGAMVQRKQAEEALRRAEEKYRSIFEHAVVGIYQSTADGRLQTANPMLARILGYASVAELIDAGQGDARRVFAHPTQRDEFVRLIEQQGSVTGFEYQALRKDGSAVWLAESARSVHDADGVLVGYEGMIIDISERKRIEAQLLHLANHDALTGLYNRYALEANMDRVVSRCRRGRRGALLILDLDNFKVVNDTVGHPVGDRLLIAVARLMAGLVRQGDLLVRLGGDEFAVLLEDTEAAQARSLAERLLEGVDDFRFTAGSDTFDITTSIGIAVIDGSLGGAEVLALADAALYEAKALGKNRVVLYRSEDEKGAEMTAARLWVARIKDSLRQGRFFLAFQPVVHLSDEAVLYYEALVRLRTEDGEEVAPGTFIPVAERFGLMPQIDRWVVTEAVATLQLRPEISLGVNLSGASLTDDNLLEYTEQLVRHSGIAPGRLTFEITETAAVTDMQRAERWMVRLKDLGCRFALDDFGTGFSSFTYLRALPVDCLKLDGSLVTVLPTDPTSRALVQAITVVAHALGKEVTAEWVETHAVAEILRAVGVEYGQGYLWGLPLTQGQSDIRPRGH